MVAIYHRSARTNGSKITLILSDCVMNGFIMFGIIFTTATRLDNSPQSSDAYTVSHSRSMVTSAENPASENSPQSIRKLDSVMDAWLVEKNVPVWLKNGVK